ncbi:MAG: hypothetical protein N2C14_00975, partial [Planctomycetales bacterium]
RILAPVRRPERQFSDIPSPSSVLAGWASRWIGDPPEGVPTYLFPSNFPKSRVLYGLLEAKQTTGPVYVVEGITDVWRIGPGAVALLGNSASHEQTLLLRHHFRGCPIVVMLDADAEEAAEKVVTQLVAARGVDSQERVVRASLAHDDPGDSSLQEIHGAAAAALGVAVKEASPQISEERVDD